MHEMIDQALSYARGLWLRRWHAIIAAWVIAVAGWIAVSLIPQRFEASARVYIDTQSILKPLMSGLAVNTSIEQQVQVMTKTLLSRPNMEKAARMTDLDIKSKSSKDMEKLVTDLMGNVQLEAASRGQENLYRITYQNSSPDVAKKVVQSLLTILVESSLGNKRKDTDAAKHFIEEQIKSYEEKLNVSENALKEFKQKNLGLIPGQGGDYFAKLSETQRSMSEANLALREAETRRDQLKRKLSGEGASGSGENVSANPELDARIQTMEKNLDQMRLSYTESHPDIVSTKRVLAQLEEQKKQEAKIKKPLSSAAASLSPYHQQLNISLAEAEAQAASLKARLSEYSSRYSQMRQQAGMVPQVEADLVQLNRDYEINKKNYDQLVSRRESAQISGDMDAKTDVIDFKVIDPPYVPPNAAFPDRPLMFSLVFLLALAGGGAFAFIMSQIRPIITDRSGVRELTSHPILGTVTMVWNDTQKRTRRKQLVVWAAACGGLLSAYMVVLGVAFFVARSA